MTVQAVAMRARDLDEGIAGTAVALRTERPPLEWCVAGIAVLLLLLLAIGHASLQTLPAGYPSHWWTPAPKEGAPVWEILPQEARPGEVILSKRNELGLLSNFAATPFTFRGQRYASLEGFWQMMLYEILTRIRAELRP
jgi:hypothetical protein